MKIFTRFLQEKKKKIGGEQFQQKETKSKAGKYRLTTFVLLFIHNRTLEQSKLNKKHNSSNESQFPD